MTHCQKLLYFEQISYRLAWQKGSYIKTEKPGMPRPAIIPRYDEIGPHIVLDLIRTAGITRRAFLSLLDNC